MALLTLAHLAVQQAGKRLNQPFNLTLQAGQIWAVLGPNGVGKTTLLHTLAGLRSPQHGTVHWCEHAITAMPSKLRAQSIGVLFQQSDSLLSQTVYESLLTARYPYTGLSFRDRAEDKAIVDQVIEQLALAPLRNRWVNQLSGGEQKRVAFARLWIQDPTLYLLDEPTNHLDLRYQTQLIAHTVQRAKQHKGLVIMALHDVNTALSYCDHILLMFDDGHVRHGTQADMLTEAQLSRLYRCSVRMIGEGQNRAFLPA